MNVFKMRFVFFLLIVVSALQQKLSAGTVVSTNGDFSKAGELVIRLLESRDTNAFAKSIVASVDDWKSLWPTNSGSNVELPSAANFKSQVEREIQQMTASAQQIVQTADRLGIGTNQVRFRLKEIRTPEYPGTTRNGLTGTNALPWHKSITIVLSAIPEKSEAGTANKFAGDYRLVLSGMVKLPSGWRSNRGLRWDYLPNSIQDEQSRREIRITAAIADHKPVSDKDDPALAELGNTILNFLRESSESVFTNEAMPTLDSLWSLMEKTADHPTRKQLEEYWPEFVERIVPSARQVLKQSTEWGLDFSSAKLESVVAENLMYRGANGSLEDLEANSVLFRFSVPPGVKSKSGKSLFGTYILACAQASRFGNQWKIKGVVRWKRLPQGILTKPEQENLDFENYVAENDTLPPGTMAPDIEFIRLDNKEKEKLSDYRGKVLVVDFWTTWCGPCQEPMAELQTLQTSHPEWKDQVKIMPLSIDDTTKVLEQHLAKKGWTNTFNVWGGPNGWSCDSAKAFRITGVPTTYIIGKDGKILHAGHPAAMPIEKIVSNALK